MQAAPVLLLTSWFGARQLHSLAAYWALAVVAAHVGMRWTLFRASGGSWLGLDVRNAGRTRIGRTLAPVIAAYGVYSWIVTGMRSRLIAK